MRDLSKALPIEELDEESRQQGRSARAAKVAAMPVSTPTERGFQRQYSDINKARNLLEDLLFLTKKADEIKIDGEDKKKSIVEKIREGIHSTHEQEGFLQLANEFNYDVAEEFRAMDSGNDEFGEETKKKLAEFKKGLKNVAPRTKPQGKNNWKPYLRGNPAPVYYSSEPQGTTTRSYISPPYGGQQAFNLQQSNVPSQGWQQNPYMLPSIVPGMQQQARGDGMGRFPKYQGRQMDKTNSTCKACLGVGHWAGDRECPMSGFRGVSQQQQGSQLQQGSKAPALSLTFQPPPPGTE